MNASDRILGCKMCIQQGKPWSGLDAVADTEAGKLRLICRTCGRPVFICDLPGTLQGMPCQGCGDPTHNHSGDIRRD